MGFISKLFGGTSAAQEDAKRLYNAVLAQSRNPQFYGAGRVPDNYDGRIDVITLHMAPLFKALNGHGEDGKVLAQAVFDEMKDDFEIALRELGIADTGIKRRIKPMIALFYTRVKSYTEGLLADNPKAVLTKAFQGFYDAEPDAPFWPKLSSYVAELSQGLETKSLGQIALMDFTFPVLSKD